MKESTRIQITEFIMILVIIIGLVFCFYKLINLVSPLP